MLLEDTVVAVDKKFFKDNQFMITFYRQYSKPFNLRLEKTLNTGIIERYIYEVVSL